MNILLADDHALFREGFALLLKTCFPEMSIHHAGTWGETYQHLVMHPTKLALIDLMMPGDDRWLEQLQRLKKHFPRTRICVVSASDSPQVITRALTAGIHGYIPKLLTPDEMCEALSAVLAGKTWIPLSAQTQDSAVEPLTANITTRQQQVLRLISDGQSNQQIAEHLYLAESTVKRHIHNIFRTINAKSRMEAVTIAQRMGILSH
jgi:DNA-binding NarL/FixJ family response regulator